MHTPLVTLNNGVAMPQLGFGVWQVPDAATESVVGTALETGYRSIDTAAIYDNEKGVGLAIVRSGIPREEIFVTSKLWNSDHGYDQALRAYDTSLNELGLDYVDLYLIHWPCPDFGKYVDTWRALERLYTEGAVRAIGVCNFLPHHLEALRQEVGLVPAVNQVELHPRFQQRSVVEVNDRLGITTEAYSPLGRGTAFDAEAVKETAAAHAVSVAQVIIRWHLQRGNVVIPKSVTEQRIRDNFTALEFELTADELSAIDELDAELRTSADPDLLHAV